MINRQEWLKRHGFYILDPFGSGSLRAETDPLLDMPDLPSFIDQKDIKMLVGSLADPGPAHIFARSGSGKSSLRRRIHHEYETSDLLSLKQNLLLLDYVDHEYPASESDYEHHLARIINLAETALATDLRETKFALRQSPELALEMLIKSCRRLGISGIYVLVDKVAGEEALTKLTSLLRQGGADLHNSHFFIVKYFLDERLFSSVRSALSGQVFSPYLLVWDENQLLQILNQRLITCSEPFIRGDERNPIARLCNEAYLADRVQMSFIQVGAFLGSPSAMWLFGDYLFEEVVFFSSETRGRAPYRINHEIFSRARDRFFGDLLDPATQLWSYSPSGRSSATELANDSSTKPGGREAMPPNLQRATGRSVEKPGNRESAERRILARLQGEKTDTINEKRQIVYLCYAEDDRDKVIDIYERLLEGGYKPWMDYFDVLPGQDPEQMKTSAVRKADNLLVLLSNNSYNKEGDFRREIKIALDNRRTRLDKDPYIIPVRLERCLVEDTLSHLRPVDIFESLGWERLLQSLRESSRIRRSPKGSTDDSRNR